VRAVVHAGVEEAIMPLSDESHSGKEPVTTVEPAQPPSVIDKVRKAFSTGQSVRIDDMTVDGLTAQTVIRIYDKMSAANRGKFERLSIKKMICKAFEMAEKGR
jgi:hypothetical protein